MKYSVLDLAPVPEGSDVTDAMRNTTNLAQRAEALGYHRYWMAEDAIHIYRRDFKPSKQLEAPYFMLAANVFGADTDAEGAYLRTSMQQAFARMQTGTRGKLPRPVTDIDAVIGAGMRRAVEPMLKMSATGSPDTVQRALQVMINTYTPDEVILTGQIHDHAARLRSFEIAAQAMQSICAAVPADS